MACPQCAAAHLIAIDVMLGDEKLTMVNCSDCGTRWWESEGHALSLPDVLDLAAERR
jgi:Zn ribbon nucleic-acid-binding protein